MRERSKENIHPYIGLSKEELLRRTVSKKKVIACQTAKTASKKTDKWKRSCGENCGAEEGKELMW